MRIDIFTLFPAVFTGPFETGIFQRAVSAGLVEVFVHNIRDYTHDKHHVADDYPYGGGAGMVMKPEPIFEAVETVRDSLKLKEGDKLPVVLLTPQGRPFTQQVAEELSLCTHLALICGHYEGVDERVCRHLVTDELSVGDYVLSGGELPAMVVVDAVTRLLPGVLGSEASAQDDSHSAGLLEYPQYTRPPDFRGWKVPEVLLSGNHARIEKWRLKQSLKRTLERRPELLEKLELPGEARRLLDEDEPA